MARKKKSARKAKGAHWVKMGKAGYRCKSARGKLVKSRNCAGKAKKGGKRRKARR